MNIDFNEFFRMRIDIVKVREDMYRLKLENIYMDDNPSKGMHNSSKEYYMNAQQLKAFKDYVNEATHDIA